MNPRLLHLILQAGTLMQMPRSHNRLLGNTFDTVASHSFHVAIIAYTISRMEKLSHEQATHSLIMGVFHDLAEARIHDHDLITKQYNQPNEAQAIKDQFRDLNFGSDLQSLVEEYEQRQSLPSQCAKDADLLQQMYQEWTLAWQGNKLAEKWFKLKMKSFVVPHFFTKSAKQLAHAMESTDPQSWWWSEIIDQKNPHNLDPKKY